MKKSFKIVLILMLVLQLFGTIQKQPVSAAQNKDEMPTKEQVKAEYETKKRFPKRGKEPIEIELQKTENSSLFLNPDGTFTKEVYSQPIQFKDESGKWKKVNNELEKTNKKGYTYKNKENKMKTYFNKMGNVKIEDNNKTIDFKLLNMSEVEPNTNKNKIEYKHIKKGSNLQYTVSSSRLKEEIILENNDAENTYTYEVVSNGYDVKKGEKNTLLFYDKKKLIYQTEPIVTYDQNEEFDKDTKVEIYEENNKWYIKIQVSEGWLNDKKRKFPVIIDPTVTNVDLIQDTFVYSADPTGNYSSWTSLRVGHNGYGKSRSFIKFEMPFLPTGSIINEAKLDLYQTLTTSADTEVDIHQVTSWWEDYMTTWNEQPTYNSTPMATITYPSEGRKSVTVTDLVKKWYSGEEANYGFMLKAKDENQTKREFASFEGTDATKTPKLIINYKIDGLGIEDFWSYDNGVNLNNGNLTFSTEDASVNGKGHPIVISRTYNSRSNIKGILGKGWQLNTEMRMKFKDDPTVGRMMTFVDSDGTESTFIYMGAEGEWFSPIGFEGQIFYDNYYEEIKMEDKEHNEYLFNKTTGRLIKTIDNNGNANTYTYNTDGTLKSVTDSSNRTVNLNYENGKLVSITGNEITKVQYSYTGDNLTKVETVGSDGKTLAYVSYSYDNDGNLTTITDEKNQTSEVTYTSDDRVSSFIEKVTDSGELKTLTTKYDYNFADYDSVITTKTNPKGIVTRYHTNDVGNIIKIEENYDASTSTSEKINELVWDENNLLTEVIDPRLKKTIFSYNGNRDVEEVVDPKLYKTMFKYDGYDLIQQTSPSGESNLNHYDTNRNQSSTVDVSGNTNVLERDKYGNITKSTTPTNLSDNLVKNSNFETWKNGMPNNWSLYGSSVVSNVLQSTGKQNGSFSARLNSTSDTSPTEIISENIPIDGDVSYNISWYGYQMYSGKTTVKIRWYDASNTFISEDVVGSINGDTQIWLRRSNSVAAPTNATYGRILLSASNARTYFDNIQMEQGQFSNQGNLVANNSYENDMDQNGIPDRWINTSNVTIDKTTSNSGTNSVKIVGDGTNKYNSNQKFEFSGKKGTIVKLSGYSKASGLTGAAGDYVLRLRVENEDGTTSYFDTSFTKSTHNWEYKEKIVVLPKDFKRFNIYGQFGTQTGTVWYDDIDATIINADNAQMSSYNLVENSSFETTDSSGIVMGWVPYSGNTGTVARVSTQQSEPVYTGEYAYRITNSSGQNSIISLFSEPLKTGKSYTLSAMVKADGVTSGGGKIAFQIRDANDTYLTLKTSSTTVTGTGDWQRIAVTISDTEAKALNANAILIRPVIYTVAGTNTAGKIYFDAVKFEENNQMSSAVYDTNGNFVNSETNEDGDTIKYTNDNRGRTTRVDFAKSGSFVETSFDELDRPLTVKDNSGLTVKNVYDEAGNVSEIQYNKSSDGANIGFIKNEYNELNEVTKTYDQNGFVTQFERDLNRNLIKTNLPNGKSILYNYSALDELKKISFNGDQNVFEFEYDKNGNLVKETKNGTETTDYVIDPEINQVNKITYPSIAGKRNSVDITYDKSGKILSYKHSPFSQSTSFIYSASGTVEKTLAPNGTTTDRLYDEKGRIAILKTKVGSTTYINHYEYNQLGNLSKKWVEKSDGTKLLEDETFSYDKNGNITQISYSGGKKDIFTYDDADRLVSEKRLTSTGSVEYEKTYTYDELGNRLTETNSTDTKKFTYDKANQLISDGTTTYTYDEVGNMLNDKNYTYSYTATDQIKEVKDKNGDTVANYEYDSSNLRTKKVTKDKTENYIYFNDELEYVTDENNNVKYSFTRDIDGKLLSFNDHTGTTIKTYYYVLNYRGDVIGIKDSNGNQVVTYNYDSYGNILSSVGTATLGNGKLLKEENPFRYASYFYDKETGLYYIKARYYNSELGRFTTTDSVKSVNLYQYSENDPVNLTDPSGMYVVGTNGERAIKTKNGYYISKNSKSHKSNKYYPGSLKNDSVGEIDYTWLIPEAKAPMAVKFGVVGIGKIIKKVKPMQIHHFLTNKSKVYTPIFNKIVKKYGLKLDENWNKELLLHQGRHPYDYHNYMLDRLKKIDKMAKGDLSKFEKEFERLKKEIRENPEMLYKDYWKNK